MSPAVAELLVQIDWARRGQPALRSAKLLWRHREVAELGGPNVCRL